MEKTIEDLTIIETYRNRQVILNYYQDEDFLWKRDGFEFTSLKVLDQKIVFIKNDGEVITIPIKEFPHRKKSSDFQNYYIFGNESHSTRLEVYFP